MYLLTRLTSFRDDCVTLEPLNIIFYQIIFKKSDKIGLKMSKTADCSKKICQNTKFMRHTIIYEHLRLTPFDI